MQADQKPGQFLKEVVRCHQVSFATSSLAAFSNLIRSAMMQAPQRRATNV